MELQRKRKGKPDISGKTTKVVARDERLPFEEEKEDNIVEFFGGAFKQVDIKSKMGKHYRLLN